VSAFVLYFRKREKGTTLVKKSKSFQVKNDVLSRRQQHSHGSELTKGSTDFGKALLRAEDPQLPSTVTCTLSGNVTGPATMQ